MVLYAQNAQTKFLQASRAFGIVREASRIGVLTTIQLDHQVRLETNEIHDVSADRMLSPKLKAVQLFATQ
jgi:hypothetical protein